MKKLIRYAYITISLLAAVSCEPRLTETPPMLVVEGWIENDAAPVVFITSSVSVSYDDMNLTDLMGHIALNAQVTVTHNGETFRLTPTLKKEYLLKICYTTSQLKGEVGGTYQLQVDWNGMQAQAVTTIPQPGTIDYTTVERHPSIDTLYLLKAHIIPSPQTRYYRFFSMALGKDSTYNTSYLGTFDSHLSKDSIMAVNRGFSNPITLNDYYYTLGDSVHYKLAAMEPAAYEFWRKYDESVMFSHVALLPYSNNLKGNIHGALGYWFGYGTKEYELRIEN